MAMIPDEIAEGVSVDREENLGVLRSKGQGDEE